MLRSRFLAAIVALGAIVPARAHADTLLIPFWGVNFGGDAGKSFGGAFDSKQYTYGLSIALMGGGVFGIEGDFAWSPDFFGKTDAGGSTVFTGSGNLLLGIPFGGQHGFGIRPYGTVGFGVLKSSADFLDVNDNAIAWNSGGGVMLFFGTRYGVRVDLRYFKTFDDLEVLGVTIIDTPGKVSFTRTSLGFIFRF
jgi:hypothetical protein